MALKTVALSVPELLPAPSANDIYTTPSGENATINSLFITHRNEPTRNDLTSVVPASPLDFKIGSRISHSYLGSTQISEGFHLIVGNDKEFDCQGTGDSGNTYIQIQRTIAGSVVTGPAINLSALNNSINVNNLYYKAFEIYPGMILLLLTNAGLNFTLAMTFTYDSTTLVLTYKSLFNLTKPAGVSGEKIVDGRLYYIGKNSLDNSSPNTLNLLKVTNGTGIISETSNVVSGFTSNGGSDVVGPNTAITPKSICRATLDSNQFLIATRNGSNQLLWLVVQFNTADDSTTLLNRVNYAASSLTIHPTVIPAYGSTGFKVFIVCSTAGSASNSNNIIYTITDAAQTTPTSSIGYNVNFNNGNFNSMVLNPTSKKAYFLNNTSATGDTRILTFTWTDTSNIMTVDSFPVIEHDLSNYDTSDVGFLSLFNNNLYITGALINTYYARLDPTTGSLMELLKTYTGSPRLDSARIKWSSFYNGYIVAVRSIFYLFDISGNLISATTIPTSIYTRYIMCFDVSATGVVCFVTNDSSLGNTGPTATPAHSYIELLLNTQKNTAIISLAKSAASFATADLGLTTYSGVAQDMICLDSGSIVAVKSNASGGSASYGIYYYYFPYGYSTNGTLGAINSNNFSLQTGNNLTGAYWNQCRLVKTGSNTFRSLFSLGADSPQFYSYSYRLNSPTSLAITNSQSAIFSINNPLLSTINMNGSMNPTIITSYIGLVSMVVGTVVPQAIRFISIDGNAYTPFYDITKVRKVVAARINNIIGVLEEYDTAKVFRVYDERTGPLAVELIDSRVITTETYNGNTASVGAATTDGNFTASFYGSGNRNYTLRSPGAVAFTADVRILKASGTVQPVISAYEVRVGATFSLGNSPIYLASGDRLQVVSSKLWLGSVSGMAIARLNVANAT